MTHLLLEQVVEARLRLISLGFETGDSGPAPPRVKIIAVIRTILFPDPLRLRLGALVMRMRAVQAAVVTRMQVRIAFRTSLFPAKPFREGAGIAALGAAKRFLRGILEH
jgi:hypothetical protein